MTDSIKTAANYAAESLGLMRDQKADASRFTADSGHPIEAPPEKQVTSGRAYERDRERGLGRFEGVPQPAVTSRYQPHLDPGSTGQPEMVEDKGGFARESLGEVPREAPSISNNSGAIGGAIGGASAPKMAGRSGNDDHGTGIMRSEDGRTTYAPDGHSTRDTRREYSDEYARASEESQSRTGLASGAATGARLGCAASGTHSTLEGRSQSNVTGRSQVDRANAVEPTFGANGDTAAHRTISRAPEDVSDERSGSAESESGSDAPRGSVQGESCDNGKEGFKNKGKESSEGKGKIDGKDKPSVTRENNDAIPIAGDRQVDSDHWGESKMLKDNETSE